MLFESVEDVQAALARQRYICDRRLATVLFLATSLSKPILVEGPAGVGKTELGKAAAAALKRTLIRLQCYEGLDETKALYEWEYGKQLLYTHVLRGKIEVALEGVTDLREAAQTLRWHEDVFFNEDFLVERPVLASIRSKTPTVLLVDEIDRADEEFEAFLLEFLSDYQVSIPELGTLAARSIPLVVLTSNATRELSEALKRRCLHIYLEYPTPEVELEIVRLKAPGLREELAGQVVTMIQSLRSLDLRKAPSVGETLDWAQALVTLHAPELSREIVEETLGVIVKHDRDARKVLAHVRGEADDVAGGTGLGQHDVPDEPETLMDVKRRPALRHGER